MARTKISEFSATPGNNTDIDSINIAEGCAPSGINDAIRELMSQLKDFQTGAVGDSFNGPVGTTTAAAGAFTTLSASSTVSGTGFSTYLASPPAIGGTTAAAGSFTTLTTSSTVTHNGGTANGVTYLNGSKVLTTGSALTFDGTNLSSTGGATFQGGPTGYGGGEVRLGTTASGQFSAISTVSVDSPVLLFDHRGTSNTGVFVWRNGSAGGNELMRLTSTGLGIGTSSPSAKLHVKQSAGDGFGSGIRLTSNTSSNNWDFVQGADTKLYTGYNGTAMTVLDSSGNLGLGVTPSAWSSGKAFEVGFLGNGIWGNGANSLYTTANAYFNGGWKYAATGTATATQQSGGVHYWFTAPSGTAGAAITFTQAMTLDASGNLLVGTTSQASGERLSVVSSSGVEAAFFKSGDDTGASTILIRSASAGAGTHYMAAFQKSTAVTVGTITHNDTSTSYNTSSDYRLKNITGPITASGAYIDSLNPVEGTWKADGSTFVGLIAHEAQEVSRTQVATGTKDGEEMQGMSYSSSEMIANMIAELKALRARVAALEAA